MGLLVPVVEGDGEIKAVPLILRRVMFEYLQIGGWEVAKAKNAHGGGNLFAFIERFVTYAAQEPGASAIIVIGDLDDGCPANEALSLAGRVRGLDLAVPTGIVLAHREYEAWFLASVETIRGRRGLRPDLEFEGDVESIRDAKGLLTRNMEPGRAYKETLDQVAMTDAIDIDVARNRSRSLARLVSAVEELTSIAQAGAAGRGYASPKAIGDGLAD